MPDEIEEHMLLHKAIRFAAVAHAGQKRKGEDVAYLVHPFEAAQILTENGAANDVICAGLLHDVLEDTPVTIEELSKEFSETIASLVLWNTEDKKCGWDERKIHTIEGIKKAPLAAKLVCCADKLSNLRSICFDLGKQKDGFWSRFHRGYREQKWYYESVLCSLKELEGQYPMYSELKQLCGEVFLMDE